MPPAAIPTTSTWFVLAAQLPDDPAARMRILRMLDAMGCAILRDGVFILPGDPDAASPSSPSHPGLDRLGQHISAGGGSHHVLRVVSDAAQTAQFARLFDRSTRYIDLIKTVDGIRSGFGVADPTSMARILMKLKRDFEVITSLDFFPSESRDRAARVLADADAQIRRILFPPDRELTSTAQMRAQHKFFRRVWVTRKPLWVDRLASAWLIRRFIDAESTVVWIERNETPQETAVSFGFEGALFCNSATEVTYQVLLASFGLDKDIALQRIAGIVHALDLGGDPVPEAAGVESLLQGAQRRAPNEAALLPETEKTFDLLYDAYFQAPASGAVPNRPG